ncbi:tRNA (adenosine(37)-N6)-threonylcarbamoyltransferase complex dimerization subunit type 1 TsaB [Pseudoclavibacter endophyticus]|uniref:tRNA (Adenosine(37)-N6)-threonylcarbamoyltransferase complex dimerization subunit type 1 TsaB n=1 Tax=Pseudoclavibacter endophyticus TaxID=1778590 RepID=A0A6H9WSK6_9MICO|nr:tRNA (adenosine(37)-N6)-threonylcarbamoyltransferase complex dimerization subunit type 1 TsaB [Pseudoclavibacter endophyticus]KAB1649324.1 tRNA (adenosine(37)-N6)-threonylcarbamoyltransferase complex dimerization subunit type 1 TsaB [Pseudoclavibacter endophyticus]
MLLALDTSVGTDAAVVSAHGRILGQARIADGRHHAESIGGAIRDALDASGLAAQHITAVVAGMGPGPFTGLRVGVAAARAFAAARGIGVVPVASHDAIAHEWRSQHLEAAGTLLVTTDARRRELACSIYPAGWVIAAEGPVLLSPDEVDGHFTDVSHRVDGTEVSAAHLALAWLDRAALGLEPDEDRLIYLRAPDAVPSGAPKRVTR